MAPRFSCLSLESKSASRPGRQQPPLPAGKFFVLWAYHFFTRYTKNTGRRPSPTCPAATGYRPRCARSPGRSGCRDSAGTPCRSPEPESGHGSSLCSIKVPLPCPFSRLAAVWWISLPSLHPCFRGNLPLVIPSFSGVPDWCDTLPPWCRYSLFYLAI